ncbi:MAG TPA: YtxH domain-containing protein [Actinomycetota bacterium]|nr:YtxH domain-containing protein [Actinomycetota bacterium]
MRFRFGAMLGFGAGYLMGTKAGRERYEEIMQRLDRFAQAERVQDIKAQATRALEQVKEQTGMSERRLTLDGQPEVAPQEPFQGAEASKTGI